MFQIGQKVVCIDASFNAETKPYMPCWIKQGTVYTIRGIHKDPNIDGYGVYLEEVVNPEHAWANDEPREWSFGAIRFKPTLLKPAARIPAVAIANGPLSKGAEFRTWWERGLTQA